MYKLQIKIFNINYEKIREDVRVFDEFIDLKKLYIETLKKYSNIIYNLGVEPRIIVINALYMLNKFPIMQTTISTKGVNKWKS